MARVTVEDCLSVVPNPFQLVLLAAQRARSLNGGTEVTVPREGDKNTVIALREIAGGTVSPAAIEAALVDTISRGPARETVQVEPDASSLPAEPDEEAAASDTPDISEEIELALGGDATLRAA